MDRSAATRMRWLRIARVAMLVVVTAISGCDALQPSREWTLEATRPDGTRFPVVVRDTTGRVTDLAVDPAGGGESLTSPPGEPNVVFVTWSGSACDTGTEISIADSPIAPGRGFNLSVRTEAAPRACDDIGVGHTLRLTASGPIPLDAVTLVRIRP